MNYIRIVLKALLVLIREALKTNGLFFSAILIYLNKNDLYTIPLGLATFRATVGASPWNLIMAVSIVAAIPPIALFFFGQRLLLSGIVVQDK